jgi:hypothetical protein
MAKSKSKGKSKRSVRGPQLRLRLSKAKGLEPARTLRLRYVEPPTKKDGNPFFALRVPAGLLRAFKAHANKKGKAATSIVREHMAKLTGYELEADGDE